MPRSASRNVCVCGLGRAAFTPGDSPGPSWDQAALLQLQLNTFCLCSEVRALVQSGLVSPDIDRRALAGYLAYGGVQEPLTIYENVFSLPRGLGRNWTRAARFLPKANTGDFRLCSSRSASARCPTSWKKGERSCSNRYARHLLSDVPTRVFLSSGLRFHCHPRA